MNKPVNPKFWTIENNNILKGMWEKEWSDKDIATFFQTSIYAIQKQRSNLGFVAYKRKQKLKQLPIDFNTPEKKEQYFTIHYRENEQNHIRFINNSSYEDVKAEAKKLMEERKIKKVIILKPYSKLTYEAIKETKY